MVVDTAWALLLRLIVGAPDECLDMMEKMCPVRLDELMRRHLYRKTESILVDSRFEKPLQVYIA